MMPVLSNSTSTGVRNQAKRATAPQKVMQSHWQNAKEYIDLDSLQGGVYTNKV